MTHEELSSMHWAALKKMVEEAGGEWQNKEKAIEFLANNQSDAVDSSSGSDVADAENAEAPAPEVKVTEKAANKAQSKQVIMLDRSQPFGTVHGELEGFPNAVYAQGGHFFNSAGEKL